jgi:hypothetical protein
VKYMRVRTTAADFKLASIAGESVNGLQRNKRESLLAGSCILLVLLGGCTTNRPPGCITCEKLRGLNVGMSRDEVRRILGDPVYETPPLSFGTAAQVVSVDGARAARRPTGAQR